MKLTKEGLELIKHFESFRSKPYKCPAGYWTVGYGHLISSNEQFTEITKQQAEALLLSDISSIILYVNKLFISEIDDNLYSACLSLAFNIGINAFKKSTLLKKINEQKPIKQKYFTDWCKAGGKVLKGLIIRRICEYQLATTGKWDRNINVNNYRDYLE